MKQGTTLGFMAAVYAWFPGYKPATTDPHSPHCLLSYDARQRLLREEQLQRASEAPAEERRAARVRTEAPPKFEKPFQFRSLKHQKNNGVSSSEILWRHLTGLAEKQGRGAAIDLADAIKMVGLSHSETLKSLRRAVDADVLRIVRADSVTTIRLGDTTPVNGEARRTESA